MKKILVVIIYTFFSCSSLEKGKSGYNYPRTEAIFLNTNDDYYAPVSEETFWGEKVYKDTIVILGSRQNNILNEKIKQFDKVNTRLMKDDFYHRVAFIRHKSQILKDTIYTDPLFKYWKIDKKILVDTTGYFKKTFSPFLSY